MTKYYYQDDNGKQIFLTEYGLKYSYFLSGSQDIKGKGLLYTCFFGNAGTTLTPVYKDGKNIKRLEYAGKDVHETEFLTNY
jgi:hypothetical protein